MTYLEIFDKIASTFPSNGIEQWNLVIDNIAYRYSRNPAKKLLEIYLTGLEAELLVYRDFSYIPMPGNVDNSPSGVINSDPSWDQIIAHQFAEWEAILTPPVVVEPVDVKPVEVVDEVAVKEALIQDYKEIFVEKLAEINTPVEDVPVENPKEGDLQAPVEELNP